MAFSGVYTATDINNWIRQVWQPEIGIATYEEMRVGNHFKRLEAPEGQINYRKHLNLQVNTLAASSHGADYSAGAGLQASGSLEAVVSGTPQTSYVYVRVTLPAIARLMRDPTDIFRKSIEMALAEGIDVVCAALFADLTAVHGAYTDNITEAVLQDAVVSCAVNMKSDFTPGQTEVLFAFHPHQIDDILGITNWTHADIRGDGENPIVKGMILRANGVRFIETGNIDDNGGTGFINGIFKADKTFGIGYNQETTVKYEEYLLEKRLIGWVDFAVLTCWEDYGVQYRTTAAA